MPEQLPPNESDEFFSKFHFDPSEYEDMEEVLQKASSLAFTQEKLLRLGEARSKAEKKIADLFGEQIVAGQLLDALQQRQVLMQEAGEEGAKEELQALNKRISLYQTALENVQKQVKEYGELIGEHEELSSSQKELIKLQAQMNQLLKEDVKTLSMGEVIQRKNTLEAQIAFTKHRIANEEFLRSQELLHNRIGKIFGIEISTIKEQWKSLRTELSTTVGQVSIIATAIASVFKRAIDDLRTIREEAGTSIKQTGQLGTVATHAITTAASQGIVLTDKMSAELTGKLAAEFEDLNSVTAQTVANAARLHVAIGLSEDEAVNLLYALETAPGVTPQIASDIIKTADQIARINNIAPQKMFHQMAQNTELVARFGKEGADQLARAAAFSAKTATSLESWDKLADASLDVNNIIQNFARLNTLGLDIGDPFTYLQLAASDDFADLQTYVQQQLRGIDFTHLNRIQRNMLMQFFAPLGFSFRDLERLSRGETIKDISMVTPEERARVASEQKIDTWVTSMDTFTHSVNLAQIALTLLAAEIIGGKVLGIARSAFGRGMLGRLFGGFGSRLLGGGAMAEAAPAVAAGGEAAVAGTATASTAAIAGGIGTLGLSGLITGTLLSGGAIGTAITEKLGWDSLLDFWRIHKSRTNEREAMEAYRKIRMRTDVLHKALSEGKTPEEVRAMITGKPVVSGVEKKLDELLSLFRKEGVVVIMDGKRVGKLIARAQGRESYTTNIG